MSFEPRIHHLAKPIQLVVYPDGLRCAFKAYVQGFQRWPWKCRARTVKKQDALVVLQLKRRQNTVRKCPRNASGSLRRMVLCMVQELFAGWVDSLLPFREIRWPWEPSWRLRDTMDHQFNLGYDSIETERQVRRVKVVLSHVSPPALHRITMRWFFLTGRCCGKQRIEKLCCPFDGINVDFI